MHQSDFSYPASDGIGEDSDPTLERGRDPIHWMDRTSFSDNDAICDEGEAEAELEGEDSENTSGADLTGDPLPTSVPEGNASGGRSGPALWFQKRWEGHWVVPNVFLRGALFAALRATRSTLSRELVATQGGFTIVASGNQLTQADLDVWSAVANLKAGNRLDISSHALLRYIDRHDGSSDRAWLLSALRRLHEFHIEVSFDDGRPGYTGPLIKDLCLQAHDEKLPATGRGKQKAKNRISAMIDPAMSTLFSAGFTQLSTSWRRQMRTKPLANWIAAYYLTHRNPWRIKVATLRRFSGATGRFSTFEGQLREALFVVMSHGYFGKAAIEGELVDVLVRAPGESSQDPSPSGSGQDHRPPPSATAAPASKALHSRRTKRSITARLKKLARWIRRRIDW